jgi:hypothetical protein
MEAQGIDLSCHESRPLSDAIMHRADLVLTMTRGHRAAILAAWPDMADRVHTLRRDGGDIADPIGGPLEMYQNCAAQIDAELQWWFSQLGDTFLPKLIKSVEGIDKEGISSHAHPLRGNTLHTDPERQDDDSSEDQESR